MSAAVTQVITYAIDHARNQIVFQIADELYAICRPGKFNKHIVNHVLGRIHIADEHHTYHHPATDYYHADHDYAYDNHTYHHDSDYNRTYHDYANQHYSDYHLSAADYDDYPANHYPTDDYTADHDYHRLRRNAGRDSGALGGRNCC